ncbi:MAG: isoprenylcysteine carboxylmethyltransferase family protein [Clostridia bacterium]|nr:isoprenylcysteine carboxylmethyltransferase family protein [Clostridia bacterium]
MNSQLSLLLRAAAFLLCGVLVLGLLLFLPAGTLHYPGAQRLLALLFVPMFLMGVVLYIKAPALLEKRLQSKEKEATQRGVIGASALMFLAAFVLAGLDFRFGWTQIPAGLSAAAGVLFLLGYAMYAEVMRENAYLSRTIEVQENQTVVSTGLYGVVRHPMYAATILMFLAMPLVLGSLLAFAVMLIYLPLIAARIRNEEAVLTEGLNGYAAYKQKVRFRLFPYIW